MKGAGSLPGDAQKIRNKAEVQSHRTDFTSCLFSTTQLVLFYMLCFAELLFMMQHGREETGGEGGGRRL